MTADETARARPPVRAPSLPSLTREDPGPRPTAEARYENAAFTEADWQDAQADHIEIDAAVFERSRLSGASLRSARLSDVRFQACDLANLRADDSGLVRVEFCNSKLLGAHLGGALITDVRFSDCSLSLASFRFATFRRVSFSNCDLRQADFQGCTMAHATFLDCDLREAQFAQGSHKATDLRGSRLEGLRGLGDLRGAVIDTTQLIDLAPMLAASIGLRVTGHTDED